MKKIMIFIVGIFFINLISAGLIGPFEQGEDINLIQTCDDCTYNQITSILYPNSTVAISNVMMTKDGTFYNYTLSSNYTQTLGTYIVNGVGDLNAVDTVWAYDFEVTSSGREITTGNSIIAFLGVLLFFILGTLSAVATVKQKKLPVKWTFILFSFIFFLAGLNLISVIIPDALINENVAGFFDSFTAISFIIFYGTGALIAIMWIFTFFQTVFYRKTLRKIEKYGE